MLVRKNAIKHVNYSFASYNTNNRSDKTVCLAQLNGGLFLGWTSPMIIDDLPFEITTSEASWLMSMFKLGMSFGCFVSIFIADFIGRKISILLAIIPTCLSWLLIVWNSTTMVHVHSCFQNTYSLNNYIYKLFFHISRAQMNFQYLHHNSVLYFSQAIYK